MKKSIYLFSILLGLPAVTFGQVNYGQSASLSAVKYLTSAPVPAIDTAAGTAGIDLEIDNINSTGTDTFLSVPNLGAAFEIVQLGGGSYVVIQSLTPFSGWASGPCQGNPYQFAISNVSSVGGNKPVYLRYQVNFATKTDWFELWDGTGSRIYTSYCEWTGLSGNVHTGAVVLGGSMVGADTMQVGFLWERSSILPMNSKMPTFGHSNSGCVYDYHFDNVPGNLVDSCAGAYPLTAGGSPTFPNTASAVQGLVRAQPTQYGAISTSISGWAAMNSATGTQQMDCLAQSVTQYNASDVLTCSGWNEVSGPAGLTFSSTTAAQPTMSGIVATNTSLTQDYVIGVTVTDSGGNTNTGTIEMGAVPLDANGVVTNLNPQAAQFFTSLIGFGYNPWGEADTLQYYMIGAQTAYQSTNNEYRQWATYPAAGGTVSYPFTAKGEGLGIAGTKLCAALGATDSTVTVCDITKVSQPFPTWIMVGGVGANNGFELIRITGCWGTCPGSGSAVLQVGFDGRGLSGNASNSSQNPGPVSAWPNGTTVGETRFQGTGTLFKSDSVRPIAQGGVPGPIGLNASSPGTVALSAGIATMTGTGTGWTSAVVGQNVLITGTTHSGAPFNFWREITGWTDATHVTLDHAAPTGMDAYSGAYQLLTPQYVSFEAPAPQDNHTIRLFQPVYGCESETACFGVGGWDIAELDGTTVSGAKYSWQTTLGMASAFGPNFYGTGLAARNFYLRSGYYPALALANSIDEYWIDSPEVAEGYAGGEPLTRGGGIIGAMADFLTNPATRLTSATFEPLPIQFTFAYLLHMNDMTPQSCNLLDSRDSGIVGAYLSYNANWDTNSGAGTLGAGISGYSTGGTVTGWTGTQAPPFVALITLVGSDTQYELVHVTAISGTSWTWTPAYFPSGSASHTAGARILSGAAMYTFILSKADIRDQNCRRNASDGYSGNEVNSWANTFDYSPVYGPLTLTNGSASGTGSGLPSGMCNGEEAGTLSISSGSYTATLVGSSVVGQGPSPWQRIYIWDGRTLNAFAYSASAYGTPGATLTLAGAWGGGNCTSSAPCTYMTENTGQFTAIWNSDSDTYADNEALKKNWACIWNSATSITLNRPWDGPTDTNYYSSSYPVMGFAQQAFMLAGYKMTGMRWASHSTNPTVASDYETMASQAATWYRNYGWDYTNSKGTFYASVSQICAPETLVFNPALFNDTNAVSTLHGGNGGNIQGCGAVGSNAPNGGANAVAVVQNAEAGSAMIQYFLQSPAANKATVDTYYGAMFGVQQIYGANGGCAASVAATCDGIVDAINCQVTGMASYKWPGFCFGMGGFFTGSYPAIRTLSQGAVQPSYGAVPISGHGIMAGPRVGP